MLQITKDKLVDLGCIVRGSRWLRGRLWCHGLALHVVKVERVHVEWRVKGRVAEPSPRNAEGQVEGGEGQVGAIICRELQRCGKCVGNGVRVSGRMLVVSGVKPGTAQGNLARKGQRGCADDGDHERLVTAKWSYEGI